LLAAQAIQLAVAALPILALVAARPETLADAGTPEPGSPSPSASGWHARAGSGLSIRSAAR
ncbi:hypothetical protein, partial [Actinoplanes philippinensis]|uniref:hypothetical protein n=1 Tax=Actinoplanes philippinensis TaxID=35752 RepID=UPI0033C18AAA